MTFEYHHPSYYKKLKPKKEKPKTDLYEEETNKQEPKEPGQLELPIEEEKSKNE